MTSTVVINACAGDWRARARELRAFLGRCPAAGAASHTILLYRDAAQREALLAQVSTPSASLIKLAEYQPEQALAALTAHAARIESDLYLFADDRSGRELSVRLACRLGGTSLTEVRTVSPAPDGLRCTKAAYGNHVQAAWLLKRRPCCLAIVKGDAEPEVTAGPRPELLVDLDFAQTAPPCPWLETAETVPEPAPAGLEHARFVLAAGMGVGSRARLARLGEIAQAIGADLGVSRPVAMNAWAPMQQLIGVSGTAIQPQVCLVAGASGAAAFLAGIERSKFVVALNTDDHAPILQCADVAVVGDCMGILEELSVLMRADPAVPVAPDPGADACEGMP